MKNPPNIQRDLVLVTGTSGSGKTFWTNQYLFHYNRVVIVNPMQSYSHDYDGKEFDDLKDMFAHCEDNPRLFRALYETVDAGEIDEIAEWAFTIGDLAVCLEETQRILPHGATKLSMPLQDLINRGRHAEISVIAVSQRPATINISLRSMYTRLVAFHQTEPDDIKWLQYASGFKEIEQVRDLKHGEHIIVTPSGIERRGKITVV